MEEYEYWTDETEIFEYTKRLREELKNPDVYKAIFGCFIKKDLYSLAQIMATMAKGRNNLLCKLKESQDRISSLSDKVGEQENTIVKLTAELEKLKSHSVGGNIQKENLMENLYKQGHSLRKIGEMLHCDKSTVKRKLIKRGYTFDRDKR